MPYIERRGGSIRVKWWGGEYILDAEGNKTNKKKYESASGPEPGIPFEDEEEAYNFGLDREHDRRHGKAIRRVDANTLMGKYCWEWFETADELLPNSIKTYRSILNAVIVPYWEMRPVGAITALEYDAWKKQVKAKYKGTYPSQILGLFRMLMEDAVLKYKMRPESPIIEHRRRGRYKKKTRRVKKRAMPMEVVHHLATNAYHVWGFTGWTYIWTIAFTGMRPPGETRGLQRGYASPNWPATDPDRERREEALERYAAMPALRVQHQLYRVGGGPVLAPPKYDSYRTLAIPPFLHEMHTALLASHDSPWVFTSLTGRSLLSTQFARDYWRPIRDGSPERSARRGYERPMLLPVEAMDGHDIYRLRHWHKEVLDEPGNIPRVAIEGRMGHELPGVEGTYSYVTPAMERRIVDYLQERWVDFWASGPWWTPPFPIPLPDDQRLIPSQQFSRVPIFEES
jgi:hypothetical protein